jgi:hypothetical protein
MTSESFEGQPTGIAGDLKKVKVFLQQESKVWVPDRVTTTALQELPFEIQFPDSISIDGINHSVPPAFVNTTIASIEYLIALEVKYGLFRRSET